MSGTLHSLRRKIDGADDLNGVVRAMKALASSSIGQYEKAVKSLDDYYRTVELGLSVCLRHPAAARFAAVKRPNAGEPIGAVVFGSDQGLVGRFNEAIVEFAMRQLGTFPGKIKKIWAVGERTHTLIADTGPMPASGIGDFSARSRMDLARRRPPAAVGGAAARGASSAPSARRARP